MLNSNYIAATHINMHYTLSTTHSIAFNNPPMHTTNKYKA